MQIHKETHFTILALWDISQAQLTEYSHQRQTTEEAFEYNVSNILLVTNINNNNNNNLICIAPECQRLQRRWYSRPKQIIIKSTYHIKHSHMQQRLGLTLADSKRHEPFEMWIWTPIEPVCLKDKMTDADI